MDAGVLRFLGLHRFQPIHALLVRQHSGRNAVLSGPEHRVLVAAKYAPGHRTFLRSVLDSVAPGNQETSASTLHRCRLDHVYAGARYVSDRAALAPRHCVHLSIWDFLCPIAIGCSLAFLYLRLIVKTYTFPIRYPRLIESFL